VRRNEYNYYKRDTDAESDTMVARREKRGGKKEK
jgi:hypothetical protein